LGFSPHPPVSVSGTVSTAIHLRETFPGSMESPSCGPKAALLSTSRHWVRVCGLRLLRTLPTGSNHHPSGGPAILLRPSSQNHPCWCRNIRLPPIDYAFRPRLRDRLTLSRLSLPRNPWVYGDRDFHPVYRYSCQHQLFSALQHSFRYTFTALRILAYRQNESSDP
jgi:hypothetical protein